LPAILKRPRNPSVSFRTVRLSSSTGLHYNTAPMKRLLTPLVLLSAFVLLPACSRVSGGGQNASSSSAAVSSEEIRETRNVSYQGTVESLGPSVTMQGTHSLALGDGRMLILESTDVDLEAYLDHEVEVFGALRPTVEAGGIIMRVERITDFSPESSASPEASSSIASSRQSSIPSVTSKSSILPDGTSSAATVAVPASSRVSSVLSSVKSSTAAVSSSGISTSAEMEARIILMTKQDLGDRNWTQQYCTNHVGFCVPVHRNWWFVSFGNTTQTLWHVEVSSESFEGMGNGPIAIDLVGGDLSGHSDKDVFVSGGNVTGYRSWSQGRHFRITADARLEAAVRYMTEHLRGSESAQ